MSENAKEIKIRDEKHRRFIAELPCCMSGAIGQTQAAHIRHGQAGGMGLKPCDSLIVPLSVEEHAKQHRISEARYWGHKLDAAKELANALFFHTGDKEKALMLISRFRRK